MEITSNLQLEGMDEIDKSQVEEYKPNPELYAYPNYHRTNLHMRVKILWNEYLSICIVLLWQNILMLMSHSRVFRLRTFLFFCIWKFAVFSKHESSVSSQGF